MIRIGIIGSIGSGKSYAANFFGYPVFNADAEVSKLYKNNIKCYFKIKKALPKYINSFPIKKNDLARAILAKRNNIKKIVKIVHPNIRLKMNGFIKRNRRKKFVILDIPLLVENKLDKKNDILIFVDADIKEINKRLKKRSNFNPKIYRQLKKLQLPVEFKKKKSNYIIRNNFKSNSLKKNVKIVMKKIIENA